MNLKAKRNFSKPIQPGQEKKLLSYFHRLCQGRQVADLPGRLLSKKEIKRVREKILFQEAMA